MRLRCARPEYLSQRSARVSSSGWLSDPRRGAPLPDGKTTWPVTFYGERWQSQSCLPEIPICRNYGGGGNRTRVRGRTGKSVYKRSLRFRFRPPAGSQAAYRRASHPLVSRFGRLALPRRQARLLTPDSDPRAETGATRYLIEVRRRVRVRCLRTCLFPGGFTRPTGDLGLQLFRRTDHVETRSPPGVQSNYSLCGCFPGFRHGSSCVLTRSATPRSPSFCSPRAGTPSSSSSASRCRSRPSTRSSSEPRSSVSRSSSG